MKPSIYQRIGEIITALNISKNAFAARLEVAGSVIYNIINERNKPSFDLLEKIISLFDVNPDYLLTGNGEMFSSNNGTGMQGNFAGSMQGKNENFNTSNYVSKFQSDIIELNKTFIVKYFRELYGRDFLKYQREYLQVKFYESFDFYRLNSSYDDEIVRLRVVYNGCKQISEAFHLLGVKEAIIEKLALGRSFDEYLLRIENVLNEHINDQVDDKLEIILSIIHIKETKEALINSLANLISHLNTTIEGLINAKSLNDKSISK